MELTACGDGNSHGNDFGAFDKQILIVRGAESEDEIEGGGDNGSIPQHDLNAIFGRGFKKGSGVVGTSDTSGKEVGAIDDASNKGAGIYGAGQGYGVYGRGGDIPENDAPEFVAVTDNTVRDDYEGAIGVAGAGKSRPGVIGSNEILHKDTV